MRTAYKWSGWEPPKLIVFVLLWLCDVYLTISLDYPWFLYKVVIFYISDTSYGWTFRSVLFHYECSLISVGFKRVIQTQRTLFFRVEKKLCKDPQTHRWLQWFLFDACHSWIATFWRPTMQRMKSQVYIPCVEGLESESASTGLQMSRSLWDHENGDSCGGTTAYS